MNSAIFIDTAGWLALINCNDHLHQQALEVYRSLGKVTRLTTDAILVETCNALSKTSVRGLATAFMAKVNETEALGVLQPCSAQHRYTAGAAGRVSRPGCPAPFGAQSLSPDGWALVHG